MIPMPHKPKMLKRPDLIIVDRRVMRNTLREGLADMMARVAAGKPKDRPRPFSAAIGKFPWLMYGFHPRGA